MSNLPSTKNYIQTESVLTREPVSESLMQGIAGSVNFAMDTLGIQHQFKLNGTYEIAAGKSSLDGFLIFDWDAEIYEVQMYCITAGLSGTTQLDIKYAANRGAGFSTIFSTLPAILYNAVHPTYVGIGDSVSNAVAPILTTFPYPVVKGGWLRVDAFTTQSSGPSDCGIIIKYRPR